MTADKPRYKITAIRLELKNYARARIHYFEMERDEIIIDSLQSDEMKNDKEEIKKKEVI